MNVRAGETAEAEIVLSPLFQMDALVVTAGPLATRQDELFQAARVVGGRDLRNRIRPSLGETLASEPGVSSTYFGPGASRPVIRGLGGDRVRILDPEGQVALADGGPAWLAALQAVQLRRRAGALRCLVRGLP